jgi:EmrB/QacA subfamily drug resistance transporter
MSSITNVAHSKKTGALSAVTRRIGFIVSAAFFIEQLDTTIISTAIPQIAQALKADPLTLNLAITAYMLGLAIVVPMSGWIADRFGARRVFAASICLFVFASLLCGVAPDAISLIAARALQGIAGALMTPVGRLIVIRAATRSELVEAMALVMVPAMVAPLVGPAAGGIIVTWFDWRWIFFVNIPLGVGAIPLVLRYLPDDRRETLPAFDFRGAVLVAVSFASGALAFEGFSGHGAGPLVAAALLGAALLTALLFLAHARRIEHPAIDVSLLRVRNFRVSMLAGSVYRIAVGGVPFLLPLSLQLAHHVSALTSGFVVLLPALGGLAMKFFSTSLLRYHGYRMSFLLHGWLSVLLLAAIALSAILIPWWAEAAVLVAFGLSRSLLMNAYGTIAYAEVPREQMASATSFFLAIQNLTTGIGVAFAALSASLAQTALPTASAAVHFAVAFGALGTCALVSVGLSIFFAPDAGESLISHPSVPKSDNSSSLKQTEYAR